MNAEIKKMDGVFPVTVASAVYLDGTGQTIAKAVSGSVNNFAKFNFSCLTEIFKKNSSATAVYKKLSEPLGSLQFVGGICANKKAYFAPNTAQYILVYDTENKSTYKIADGLGDFAFKYTGFACWKGKVYAIPRGVNTMLQIDPQTDEVQIINLGTSYPEHENGDYRDSHHYNGVISNNGFMYLPPAYSSNKLLKINMTNFSWQEIPFTSSDVSTWIGCVKHPTENKIIFLSTKVFRIWDCETDTFKDVVSETERACYDMVYDPRHECFYGIYPNHIFAFFVSDNRIVDSEYINYISTGYGVSLGVDGKIYHLEGKNAFCFSFDGEMFKQLETVTTEDDLGSQTPTLAGQAIDNDGNIYGVPASGAMTVLEFSGVQQKFPDYIVSSAYYGKY